MTQQVVVVFAIAGLFLLGIALLAACSHGRRRPNLAADAQIAADIWELRHPWGLHPHSEAPWSAVPAVSSKAVDSVRQARQSRP
jgi:hypothetical protein